MKHLIFQIFNSLIKDTDVYDIVYQSNNKQIYFIHGKKIILSYYLKTLTYDKETFKKWFSWVGMDIMEEYIAEWVMKNTDFIFEFYCGQNLNEFPSHIECITQIGRKDKFFFVG